jgi:hypothetical protein
MTPSGGLVTSAIRRELFLGLALVRLRQWQMAIWIDLDYAVGHVE